ncbi:MAG: AI-2E family transporter [Anaerolineae bacterium]
MSLAPTAAAGAPGIANRTIVVSLLAGLAVAAVVYPVRAALFLMAVALMLHIGLNPLADRLRRLGVRRSVAVVIVYAVVASILVGSTMLLGPRVIAQTRAMAAALPDLYARFHASLLHDTRPAAAALAGLLPPRWDPTALRALWSWAAALGPNPVEPSVRAAGYFRAFLDVIAIFVLAFYLTADRERLVQGLLLQVPNRARETVRELIAEIEQKAGQFYRGQLILCGIVGVSAAIAYSIMGLPYALLLGVLAALLEAVPLIGASLAAVAPVMVALTQAPHLFVAVVIFNIILQLVEGNVLTPRVMGHSVGVNAVVSIVAVLMMSSLYGLLGAFIAIPVAAIIQVIMSRMLFGAAAPPLDELGPTNDTADNGLQPGRDTVALLRYRALELQHDAAKRMREPDRTREAVSIRHEEAVEDFAAATHALLLSVAALQAAEMPGALQGVIGPTREPSAAGSTNASSNPPGTEVGPVGYTAKQVVTTVVAVAAVGILLWEVREVVTVVLIGIVASTALRRPVLALGRRGASRRVAVLLIGTLVGALAGAGAWVIWVEAGRLPRLADDVLGVYGAAHDALGHGSRLGVWLASFVPDAPTARAWFVPSTPMATAELLGHAVRGSVRFMTAAGLATIIAAYWLIDGDYFARLWFSLLQRGRLTYALNAWEKTQDRLGDYLRSELGQGLFVAASLAGGLTVVGLRYALPAALLVALAWFVPFFGGPMAIAIALAVGLVDGPRAALLAALLTAFVLFVSEVVVEERLLGHRQHASVMTVLVLIALTRIWGIVGLIAAPIVAQVIDVVWRQLWLAFRRPSTADSGDVAERLAALRARRDALVGALALDAGAASDRIHSLTARLEDLLADVEDLARTLDDGHSGPTASAAAG